MCPSILYLFLAMLLIYNTNAEAKNCENIKIKELIQASCVDTKKLEIRKYRPFKEKFESTNELENRQIFTATSNTREISDATVNLVIGKSESADAVTFFNPPYEDQVIQRVREQSYIHNNWKITTERYIYPGPKMGEGYQQICAIAKPIKNSSLAIGECFYANEKNEFHATLDSVL